MILRWRVSGLRQVSPDYIAYWQTPHVSPGLTGGQDTQGIIGGQIRGQEISNELAESVRKYWKQLGTKSVCVCDCHCHNNFCFHVYAQLLFSHSYCRDNRLSHSSKNWNWHSLNLTEAPLQIVPLTDISTQQIVWILLNITNF